MRDILSCQSGTETRPALAKRLGAGMEYLDTKGREFYKEVLRKMKLYRSDDEIATELVV